MESHIVPTHLELLDPHLGDVVTFGFLPVSATKELVRVPPFILNF